MSCVSDTLSCPSTTQIWEIMALLTLESLYSSRFLIIHVQLVIDLYCQIFSSKQLHGQPASILNCCNKLFYPKAQRRVWIILFLLILQQAGCLNNFMEPTQSRCRFRLFTFWNGGAAVMLTVLGASYILVAGGPNLKVIVRSNLQPTNPFKLQKYWCLIFFFFFLA